MKRRRWGERRHPLALISIRLRQSPAISNGGTAMNSAKRQGMRWHVASVVALLTAAFGVATAASSVSTNVHIFYYPWYGNPAVSGAYRHWQQGGHTPPNDIGSNYYPVAGAYDSADYAHAVALQMQQIAQAGIGTIVYSWWGEGSPEDKLVSGVMKTAAQFGVTVAWHIEPYRNRTAASVVSNINYINSQYASSPAYFRDSAHGKKGAFYVFASGQITDWTPLDAVTGQNIVLANIVAPTDLSKLTHFNGFSTYGNDGQTADGWADVGAYALAHGKVWAPSVAPGFINNRAGGGNPKPTPDRNNGKTYDLEWHNAITPSIGGNPSWVSITSFNEWHEGTQIEPASSNPPAGYGYLTYNGAYGKTGTDSQTAYLDRTRYWVSQFTSSAVAPPPFQ